ncbi:hypothetical protein T12_16620 [Trichinella patagoniensis]|uniref:Uncharacterized protein n=1 Tax=Trichinella patagoniensis TaxID=990121 RepID=A0A0V0ZZQ0_9BILA|nr:hypothetical protein T12_5006 [Trichinella patagoniensis]KRY18157.1 hypothetical protein T12_16620 [Trichinella patagoniensis]
MLDAYTSVRCSFPVNVSMLMKISSKLLLLSKFNFYKYQILSFKRNRPYLFLLILPNLTAVMLLKGFIHAEIILFYFVIYLINKSYMIMVNKVKRLCKIILIFVIINQTI